MPTKASSNASRTRGKAKTRSRQPTSRVDQARGAVQSAVDLPLGVVRRAIAEQRKLLGTQASRARDLVDRVGGQLSSLR